MLKYNYGNSLRLSLHLDLIRLVFYYFMISLIININDRTFFCKKSIFSKLKEVKKLLKYIFDEKCIESIFTNNLIILILFNFFK